MLDYYHYTKDPSYNDIIIEALLAPSNLGHNHDYVPKEHELEEGNDDLFFWGTAVLSAALSGTASRPGLSAGWDSLSSEADATCRDAGAMSVGMTRA